MESTPQFLGLIYVKHLNLLSVYVHLVSRIVYDTKMFHMSFSMFRIFVFVRSFGDKCTSDISSAIYFTGFDNVTWNLLMFFFQNMHIYAFN